LIRHKHLSGESRQELNHGDVSVIRIIIVASSGRIFYPRLKERLLLLADSAAAEYAVVTQHHFKTDESNARIA
jgi:hypothetical protein